ncbi:MAG: hypothetical protein A3A98_03310 [Candidatus Staskawiczbacteria bacterium RIFCSPLOWO2_01_FULL_40_39]|uniref:phenylalanine--tRNA ligase n=1 Tax=Candidatus Staskawiczbacteria bacterium RIFCSPHIGHO2_01_FULL_39_25 TaxID=1802202 RepID=A0A1G2HRN4_9BACT|nr:MAG: hypothetical protein A2730_02585 [Candidatus Staskawiczbacteria bacterium RIFCSPHIGHO2_01_FULL_39_25]OGZ72843.1 MAG: hypothetical protein A3A98_03310 [Candidatus Staskawiczbacteria bacterium RIFCSPLOWO2_01_FULL_40_39]
MRQSILINNDKEKALIADLEARKDINSERIKRLLALQDLTKKEYSPIKILVDQIISLPRFADFDLVDFPRIVTVEEGFDLLNAPKDHPSRRETDTYYVTEHDVLRTQMTVMWSFYLKDQDILAKLKKEGWVGALSTGIVFRKDEIDRSHFPAFHQIDGLYVCEKSKKQIVQKDLEDALVDVAKSVFGKDIEYNFSVETFPFTDPSVELNLKFGGKWMEVLGSGLVHKKVLENLGLDPEKYNGWAFGMGIERLAMVKMEIPDIRIFWSEDPRITSQFKDINSKYKEVSKYPAVLRDISFVIDKNINLNNYYELVRDQAGNLIEQVELVDQYENEEKWPGKKSYTFRVIYRSLEKTLTNEEVNNIHDTIVEKTKGEFGAVIR